MIVAMKKVLLVVQEKDAESAVEGLRRLGILHIEHIQEPKSKDINLLQEDLSLFERADEILTNKDFIKEGLGSTKQKFENPRVLANHIIELRKRYDHLDEYSRCLQNQINLWQGWGDFDPAKLENLSEKNIYARLYQIPQKDIDSLPKEAIVEKISIIDGVVNCIIFSLGKIEIPYKEIALPKTGLQAMKNKLAEDKSVMDKIQDDLSKLSGLAGDLSSVRLKINNELEFVETIEGMGRSNTIAYLSGYSPFDKIKLISDLAGKEKWAVIFEDPKESDNVPVLLRNAKWVSLIKPIFKLMDVMPGYRELDVSPLFLIFLSLFFGMIIGDAGYGAVYFLLTLLAQKKLGRKVKEKQGFYLFYLFSSCAIIWGLLTGTVFGQSWYTDKGFKALLPVLNDAKFLMSFCFFLGAVQLSLAHGWQAVAKLPSLKALSDIGFICLLWAGFFLAKMFIVGDPFPIYGTWLIWTGVFLIAFFTNPQKNIFKSFIEGLGVLALGAMGNFGDVVSYIRLFAVGLAGVAVADSVNALAMGAGDNIIARSLILLIGHTINIVLGPISVLVHGIRLNVLEFSVLHGNVTWSGLTYKPLKNNT